jgi:tRNA-2-methylthio-N6-dimethylallyladenosine synthase
MNERDSETVAGLIEEEGYERAERNEDADIVIVNTCSVRDNADRKFFGILGQVKKLKEKKPELITAVCGCMMQQEHVRTRIAERYGWVDVIFGPMSIHRFPELVELALEGRAGVLTDVAASMDELVEGLPAKREYKHKGYVNIMYGCDNFCSYCIVPYTRGREVSRAPESIVDEVRGVAEGGAKEVSLLGQNVYSYAGRSAAGRTVDMAELICELEEVPGLARIRFMTPHPKDLSDRLIALYARGEGKLCPGIHLPAQSGSNRVLALMNRSYDQAGYLQLIEKLRAANPDIVISTDLIVGFPGETDEDFEETMDLVEKARYDSAFTFIFSPRRGTPAATMEDCVPDEVKHARFDRMVGRLNEIALEKNSTRLGRVYEVLVDGPSKNDGQTLTGRTPGGKLVNFSSPPSEATSLIGKLVDVRITGVGTFSFTGELIVECELLGSEEPSFRITEDV